MTLPETTTPEAERRLTLKQAAKVWFGDERHAATLRAEVDRGNLVAPKIGRAYWTTLTALKEMEAKCLAANPSRDSGLTKKETPGPSYTAEPVIAQGAASRKLNELRKHFGTTSKSDTSRPQVRTRSSRMSSQPTPKSTSSIPSRVNTSSTT